MAQSENENLIVRAAEVVNDNLPAIQVGHATPAVVEQVRKFYLSIAEIFEAWVRRCNSPHTRRAYRVGVLPASDDTEMIARQ